MRKLTFINTNGDELVMGDVLPLFVNKLEGTGAVDINIISQKSPYQDGETYIDNDLEYRPLYIEGTIWERDRKLVARLKRKILRVLNPKLHMCKLIYEHDGGINKINCIVDGAPIFPDNSREMYQRFLINLYCPDPYWKDISESKIDISTEVGNFSFPWEIPEEGTELSIRVINFISNIYNPGDVDTPLRIHLKATGTVENPIITNINTGDYIRVNRILADGDVLEINTEFGNKRVEIIRSNGERENAFHYIDYKSTFFSVEAGDTTIKYDAEVGENNLDVRIYYTPKYLGV